MQFLALYQAGAPGMFLGCNDTNGFVKAFRLGSPVQGQLNFVLINRPEITGNQCTEYSIPYESIVGSFNGDWFSAAEIYRAWGTNQYWARQSRLQNNLVPDWALKTGLWVWNRGLQQQVLPQAAVMQKEAGVPVSVYWHWWHGCTYDVGFPEYLPPRGGVENFTNGLAAAHQQGLHAMVYMNSRLWGKNTKSWSSEAAENYAVKESSTKIHEDVFDIFTDKNLARCASMCVATEFWRNKYSGIAGTVTRQLGVDGIYMDQACNSLQCVSSSHGHPQGGGRYWIDGFGKLTSEVRSRSTENTALSGENCGECWLPMLDMMMTLEVSHERQYGVPTLHPIPLFQAVYHPYAIQFGSYASLTIPPYEDLWPADFAPVEPLKLLDPKLSTQFLLEEARGFVWGQQPTLANFMPSHLRDRPRETAYVINLARLRNAATKYLLHGTMLRPPETGADQINVFFSKSFVYDKKEQEPRTFNNPYPATAAAAWQAPDGEVAVTLASIQDRQQELSLSLDRADYKLPREGKIYRLEASGRKLVGNFDSATKTLQIPVSLTAREACIIEITK